MRKRILACGGGAMNDDLISRKSIIADIRSRKYIDKALCEIFETVIEDALIAFDKEKVAQELQEAADLSVWDGMWHIELQKAIEIIEKGGIK